MNDRQEALNKLLKGLKSVQRKKEESEETNMDDSNIKPKDKKYKLKEVLKINCPRGCNLKITIKGDNAKVTGSKR